MLPADLEALAHAAIDDTLSDEEQRTFALLVKENPAFRSRVTELRGLVEVLDSLAPAEPPPTLAHEVLAQIQHLPSAKQSSPAKREETIVSLDIRPFIRRGVVMNRKVVWGLAAAAVVLLAVLRFTGSARVEEGTQATVGAAQRYQAPQISAKDVAVGDTRAQAVFQSDTWALIVKNETMRTALQNQQVRELLASPDLLAALRQDAVVRVLGDANLARLLNDPNLIRSLQSRDLVQQITSQDLRAAMAVDAFAAMLRNADLRAWLAQPGVSAALASRDLQRALADPGLAAALRLPQFGQSLALRGGCDEWGCGLNSPIVDGIVLR